MIRPPLPVGGTDGHGELDRLARDAEMFKFALSLLSPEQPSRGPRLLQKAYQAIGDRADCAELEAAELREELANLKQGRAVKE